MPSTRESKWVRNYLPEVLPKDRPRERLKEEDVTHRKALRAFEMGQERRWLKECLQEPFSL